jgi:hypothetical protein
VSTNYGPTKTLVDSLGDRREELHRASVEFFESNYRGRLRLAVGAGLLVWLGRRSSICT